MQLSAKALLQPFDVTILPVEGDDDMENDVLSEGPDDVDVETGFEDSDNDSNNRQADRDETEGEDDDNDDDPLKELNEEEQEELLQNTAAVSTALNKVCCDPPSRSRC
jgi:hypothetical protein